MSDLYTFHQGTTPLLLSIPHAGTAVPEVLFDRWSQPARTLPDTDWHVPVLYDFAQELGLSILQATYSRYVIDLNRPPDGASLYPGQATTGLCPETLFDGTRLYQTNTPLSDDEIAERRVRYWHPYHTRLAEELARIRAAYGYALLYDAHSIASRVPRLFEGRLPDLNLGTARGTSCAPNLESTIAALLRRSGFSYAVNGRFVGGYITRHYGNPAEGIHAIQMEIAQASYMDEVEGYPYNEAKAAVLKPVLREVLTTFLAWGASHRA